MNHFLHDSLTALSGSHRYHQWICEKFEPHFFPDDTLLDIGSGIGNLAVALQNYSFKKLILSDRDARMLETLHQRFSANDRFHVAKADILHSSSIEILSAHGVTVIVCANVLEHIEDDNTALRHMYEILPQGGRLLLMVPALPFLYGSLDREAGHFRRYTKRNLHQKLSGAGFRIQLQDYMNLLGTVSWFSAVKILRIRQFDPKAMSRLDRWVPFLKRLDNCLPRFIGQSLVSVGLKAA